MKVLKKKKIILVIYGTCQKLLYQDVTYLHNGLQFFKTRGKPQAPELGPEMPYFPFPKAKYFFSGSKKGCFFLLVNAHSTKIVFGFSCSLCDSY